jgi:hypothetical protein
VISGLGEVRGKTQEVQWMWLIVLVVEGLSSG